MKTNTYGSHNLFKEDIAIVNKVLKSNFLTQGPYVKNFENKFSKTVNCNYSIAVNSGTSALHLACLALNLNKKDIFWTTPISFVASANCGLMTGAKVDFVDINLDTGNISLEELKKKLKLAKKNKKLPKLIIVVHFAGNSPDMKEIFKLSKLYNFKIIEDGCHSLGGKINNSLIGSCKYSHITTFSFHPVKNITSAEGGMICTNNKRINNELKLLRTHGILKFTNNKKFRNKIKNGWYYQQILLGYNYRMSDIHAALGLSQLNKLKYFVKKRNMLSEIYRRNLNYDKFEPIKIDNNNYSGMHIFVVKINIKNISRYKLINFLNKKNIGTQIHYSPIHLQPYYKNIGFKKGDFKNAEKFSKNIITLPLHTLLTKKDILFIVKNLNSL